MGNTSSKERHDEHTVDLGLLVPFGVYSAAPDYNVQTVVQLIVDRRLAPFYRPLEDYDDSWDDNRVLNARKPPPAPVLAPSADGTDAVPTPEHTVHPHATTTTLSRFKSKEKDKGHHAATAAANDHAARLSEAAIYRGAVECPICLLYYPPNINHSRCCDQAICTECFIQIKRAEPTPNHLVSEPAACPYCVRDNFGVVYTPPPWRTGIGADSQSRPELLAKASSGSSTSTGSKRKSISHTSPEVVLVDHIHTDWEQKLAQVQAAVARRANRRILMRQVGDRLIPVGVTSGRVQVMQGPGAVLGDGTGALLVPDATGLQIQGQGDDTQGRRNGRNRTQGRNQDLSQLLGGLSLGGPDLEELMIMEAMRLSLLEEDERQKRERDAAARAGTNANGEASGSTATAPPPPTSSSVPASAPPISSTPTRASHTQSRSQRGSRELSPAAVHNLASSALGRAALSGALAIGLPLPRTGQTPPPQQQQQQQQQQPAADRAPAHASASSSPVATESEQLLISVPVAALTDAMTPPTEQAAVATAEPLPTPSANIDAEINRRLQAPLEPQSATTTSGVTTTAAPLPQTSAKGKERAHDEDEDADTHTHTHTEPA